jgi:hypothetical protein
MVFIEVAMMQINTYETYKNNRPYSEKWYVAAFKVHRVQQQLEITQWCYKTYGESGYNYNTHDLRWRDNIHEGEINFSRKSDLEWFLLRWQ